MNWVEIQGYHFNLAQVVAFQWTNGYLRISTTIVAKEYYYFPDPDCHLYRKLCNACCMNIADSVKGKGENAYEGCND